MMKLICFCLVLGFYLCLGDVNNENLDNNDVSNLYESFKKSLLGINVKSCPDKTMMLPKCNECIPGLMKSHGSKTCDLVIPSTSKIKEKIERLTVKRLGKGLNPAKPYGLYPYLETPEFMFRQQKFGELLSLSNATNILDIGSYYNPINLFFKNNYCPKSVVIVEPILDPISIYIPCKRGSFTHLLISPFPFVYYPRVKKYFPSFDAVVCIGCDSVFGPNRNMLETSFTRPYVLYLEYPKDYIHDAPFNSMLGQNKGEKMLFQHTYIVNTTQTEYKVRVMKIIEYK